MNLILEEVCLMVFDIRHTAARSQGRALINNTDFFSLPKGLKGALIKEEENLSSCHVQLKKKHSCLFVTPVQLILLLVKHKTK